MQPEEIQVLLETALNDCEIRVAGEGNRFDVLAIGEIFADLRPVKKQQLVYAVLNPLISDGTIHAVNIRTFTPAQWASQSS
jgi:acid stress-induced BolA-like protein IbaG/YrbA